MSGQATLLAPAQARSSVQDSTQATASEGMGVDRGHAGHRTNFVVDRNGQDKPGRRYCADCRVFFNIPQATEEQGKGKRRSGRLVPATWFLALSADRPAVEVHGVEPVSNRDRKVRVRHGAVAVGRPCEFCGRTFETRADATVHARAHASVERAAYVDFEPRPWDDPDVIGHLAGDPAEQSEFGGKGARFTNASRPMCRLCGRAVLDQEEEDRHAPVAAALCADCSALVEASHVRETVPDARTSLDAWVDAVSDMYVRQADPDDARAIAKARYYRLGAQLLRDASRPDRQFSPVRRFRLCRPGQHRGVHLANGAIECKRCHERKSA